MKRSPAPRTERSQAAPWCTVLPGASRRHVLAQALGLAASSSALLLAGPAQAQPKETYLPTPTSLREAALAAQAKGEPLVLLVSLPGCVWCELLRRSYLAPMRQEGVQAFQITVNDRQVAVGNFQGQSSHGADIAAAYQAKFTPTLMFLNVQGQEIAKRIVGVASVDLVGGVIDERLTTARHSVLR
jgi:hypothetical protein